MSLATEQGALKHKPYLQVTIYSFAKSIPYRNFNNLDACVSMNVKFSDTVCDLG